MKKPQGKSPKNTSKIGINSNKGAVKKTPPRLNKKKMKKALQESKDMVSKVDIPQKKGNKNQKQNPKPNKSPKSNGSISPKSGKKGFQKPLNLNSPNQMQNSNNVTGKKHQRPMKTNRESNQSPQKTIDQMQNSNVTGKKHQRPMKTNSESIQSPQKTANQTQNSNNVTGKKRQRLTQTNSESNENPQKMQKTESPQGYQKIKFPKKPEYFNCQALCKRISTFTSIVLDKKKIILEYESGVDSSIARDAFDKIAETGINKIPKFFRVAYIADFFLVGLLKYTFKPVSIDKRKKGKCILYFNTEEDAKKASEKTCVYKEFNIKLAKTNEEFLKYKDEALAIKKANVAKRTKEGTTEKSVGKDETVQDKKPNKVVAEEEIEDDVEEEEDLDEEEDDDLPSFKGLQMDDDDDDEVEEEEDDEEDE